MQWENVCINEERLISCNGSKLAWKAREIHGWNPDPGMACMMQWEQVCMENSEIQGWTPGPGMTNMMLWKQCCMENEGDLLLSSWYKHDLCNAMAASLHGKKREIHGCASGPDMTYMVLNKQVCMENKRDPFSHTMQWKQVCKGKKRRSMVQLLDQSWLTWCIGSKHAWKWRETHG